MRIVDIVLTASQDGNRHRRLDLAIELKEDRTKFVDCLA